MRIGPIARPLRRCSLPLAMLVACGPQVELETDSASDTTVGTTTVDTATTVSTTDPDDTGPAPTQRQVDLLFVVDNSGSMGEEQAKLANAVESLLGALDGATPPVDYRIAVTTTDNGNPWCGQTSPEAGQLRATSCRQRQTEFVFNGAQVIDMTQEACLDVCSLDTLGISDPWIDVQTAAGASNVGDGTVADNLRCMLPQGIDGCGFESPLESMWKAIRRSATDDDQSYGFHRDGALLAVAIVSDEADCSYNNEWESIFLPDGNRVFWSDPAAASPTSAVCWNAGVVCEGVGVYDCYAEDYDVDGNAGVDPDYAVLRPVDRYTEILQSSGAYVFAIDGVSADGSVLYADSLANPQFQSDFGIGPGCEGDGNLAVPPVRIHEMIELVSGGGNERSICDADFGGAMGVLAQGILSRLP